MRTAGRWTPSVPSLKNQQGLKFNEKEALKEAIVILVSTPVRNGAALVQPPPRCGYGEIGEIRRYSGSSSSRCYGLFHRSAHGSSVRIVRVIWREPTVRLWAASMAAHGP